jgi:hypothetical protein
MGVLAGTVVVMGAILIGLAALHVYAKWTISSIDRENAPLTRSTSTLHARTDAMARSDPSRRADPLGPSDTAPDARAQGKPVETR